MKDKVNEICEKWVNFKGTIQGEIILLLDMKVELRQLEESDYRNNKIEWCTKLVQNLEKML